MLIKLRARIKQKRKRPRKKIAIHTWKTCGEREERRRWWSDSNPQIEPLEATAMFVGSSFLSSIDPFWGLSFSAINSLSLSLSLSGFCEIRWNESMIFWESLLLFDFVCIRWKIEKLDRWSRICADWSCWCTQLLLIKDYWLFLS